MKVFLILSLVLNGSLLWAKDVSVTDLTVLFDAKAYEASQGFQEDYYDYSQIPYLPVFDQLNPNDNEATKVGLINPKEQEALLKSMAISVFDKHKFPMAAMVVAFRLDPCSNSAELFSFQEATCKPQLRLVAEIPSLEDKSVHVIYSLNHDDFRTALAAARAINTQCDELDPDKLSVHPCSHEGQGLEAWNEWIRKEAKQSRLVKLTFQNRIREMPSVAFWVFAGTEKNSDGHWKAVHTHAMGDFIDEFYGYGKGGAMFRRLKLGKTDRQVEDALNQPADLNISKELVALLEDTKKTHVNNTSCMSCHASMTLRARHNELKMNDPYFEVGLVEKEKSANAGFADVRHLGCFFEQCKISPRVRKESAESLELVKRLYGRM